MVDLANGPVADRFFAHLSHTGGNNPAPRMLNREVYENGYAPFLGERCSAARQFGAVNALWMNPGGNDGGDMDADQIPALAESADPKLRALAAQFPQALDFYRSSFSGAPFVYFGCMLDDQSFDGPIADGKPGLALARLFESYQQPITAGVGIGFDKISRLPQNSWQAPFLTFLRRLGVRIGIEPLPARSLGEALYPWERCADVLTFAKESFYQRNKNGTGPNKTVPAGDIIGPICRIAHQDEAERRGMNWATMSNAARGALIVDICVTALAEGDCVSASLDRLADGGVVSITQLALLVEERLGS